MTYQKQIWLALAGCAVCASPLLLPLIPKIGAYAEAEKQKANLYLQAENLKTEEEYQRSRITERAKTSETLYRTGVAPNARILRIRRYIDNAKVDPKPDTTGWNADELVYVHDSTGVCIGKIENNQWFWIHKYNNACN